MNSWMVFTKFADKAAIILGGTAYYKTKISEYRKNHTDKKARELALIDFRRASDTAQQYGEHEGLNTWQRAGSLGKLLTVFSNSKFQYYRLWINAINNLRTGRGSRADNIRMFITQQFILPGLFQMFGTALSFLWDDDEEFFSDDMIRTLILGPVAYPFIFGELAVGLFDAIFTGRSFKPSNILAEVPSVLLKTAEAGHKLVTEDDYSLSSVLEFAEIAGEGVGNFTGFPAGVVARTAYGAYDLSTGRTNNPLRLTHSKYMLSENKTSRDAGLIHRHLQEGTDRDLKTFLAEAEKEYGDKFDRNQTRLQKEYKIYDKYGFDNPEVNFLYTQAKSNKDKAKYLKEIKAKIGHDKFIDLLREYHTPLGEYYKNNKLITINNIISNDLLTILDDDGTIVTADLFKIRPTWKKK